MIFKISWTTGPCRWRWCGFDWGWSSVVKSIIKSLAVHVWQNCNEKKQFSRPTFHRYNSITQGVAKLLTRYFTTSDHPLLKPHSSWPAGDPCQGSAASKIRNHCISPSLRVIRGWVIYDSVRFANFCFSNLIESETLFADLFTLEKLRRFFS